VEEDVVILVTLELAILVAEIRGCSLSLRYAIDDVANDTTRTPASRPR
jgi:hypothetical protein